MSVLDIAERIDGYRTACYESEPNAESRKGQKYELATITKTAENFLVEAVQNIPILKGCDMVIIDSSADNGMPHTRPPNYVCLPASMCKESAASDTFKNTLIHEGIHVHQRKNKGLWESALKRAGWTPVAKGIIPADVLSRIRLNPDTIGIPFYAFNEHHIPLPLFPPNSRATFNSVQIKWFDTRSGALYNEAPKEFIKKYGGNINQPEHPYEIYAEIFSNKNEDITTALSNI
jgi:hypothetical protein